MRAAPPVPSRLRLLLVVDSLEVGGAERSVIDLAIALTQRGHVVQVACSFDGPFAELLGPHGIPPRVLMRRPVKRRSSVLYAWRLRRLLAAGHFDLVHAHCHASALAAALATTGRTVPLVVTEHTEARWQGPVTRLWSRWTHRRAACIVAVSAPIGRRVAIESGVSSRKVVTLATALPHHARVPPWASPPLVPGRCDGPLIGVIARLHRDKGVDLFLRALALVQRRRPKVEAVIIGDGPERVALESEASRLGVEVHFTGCLPDASLLLPQLDLLVVPSRTEGSPLVVLEAMAAGVPLVATGAGGIPDQVRAGIDALLVPAEDPIALATMMLAALDGPDAAQQRARSAQDRAARCFDHHRTVDALLNIYRAVLLRPLPQETAAQVRIDLGCLD